MDIQGYLNEVRKLYQGGQTTEHSFRPALARLFESIDPGLTVINEPRRTVDVGAPDFVFQRGAVSIGWCEAKDIGKDVRKFAANDYSKAQKDRYRKGLPNLIYTNGLDFEFIREGEVVDFVAIADLAPGLPAKPEAFATLQALLANFATVTPLSVTSSKRLAELMAGKASLIKDIMGRALVADFKAKDGGAPPTDLIGQYEAFKSNLIHDITVEEFADIYAETIAYGLFAARLHDETPASFNRAEALELLPKSNPFLRELFIYIAGPNLDDRLRRVVDDLCAVFLATDMGEVLRHFGKVTARQDPFLHFYENFLAEYNPAKRKARGVWYTPEPVVNFIVRAVDEVLKTEFGLADGLADTSRVTIDWDTGQNDPKTGKPATIKREVHRVQVLDPATGTGTFLAEVVKLVAERVKGVAPGQWSQYVESDLIPRIHGFELLMASYAMCHMKLDMILTGLGYKPSTNPPRLGVYLTNSLEEGERVEQTLFGLSRAIAEEAKAASDIKRQTPIMCVVGNPPYSGESANKGPWIMGLMEDYKQEPGGKQRLKERNPKWINDDYVKFIRFAQHMIDQTGEGVLGYITNHGYLDNPTFRGMRWHLLDSFDRIYVLDLHGNSKKKEVAPDGSADRNVFDIQQGVAIVIAIKRARNSKAPKPLAQVLHGDLWGAREGKYAVLWDGTPGHCSQTNVRPRSPFFSFVHRDEGLERNYSLWHSVPDLFPIGGTGVVTKRDNLTIHREKEGVWQAVKDMLTRPEAWVRSKYNLPDDVRDWQYEWAIDDLSNAPSTDKIKPISYRPFDQRFIYFTGRSRGFVGWPVEKIMRNFVLGENIGLATARSNKNPTPDHFFITQHMMETKCAESSTQSAVFPLYIYPDEQDLDQSMRVNFDPKLYAKFRAAAGLTGKAAAPDRAMVESGAFRTATGDARPDEVKVFDYIYGVLHSPAYRETYAEFLKIDFPRFPLPPSPEVFRVISEKGEKLRRLHLMENAAIGETPFPFQGAAPDGQDCMVDKPRFETGRVYINGKGLEGQHFEGVSGIAWNFQIGGYQPAQKWLKDRKGRVLSWDDIRHYQRIIKILGETHRIMQTIEMPPGEIEA
ncbi:DNA methyltransferase [Sphingomonas ursincola]|uniref:site-specific DNA-methyltransferase (adenine-specific) n=1 Tax=Sphingomonas ursincola TaxID=56361 RepID=A0A7V8REJ6_9SPHN|nr:type ISP restriction/modification enzyme [Sphingomonas ursincola]MBA1374957.1 DNA methyltransferase [Sphingomonas ursincola]